MSEAPFVRIEGLTRRYGAVRAVEDVSLDIARGELFCLLGGSGCGKSTLLRMLAGFETPTAGRVVIDGRDMAGVAPHARDTNMMFQSYALFPHMSVARNVGYGLRRAGLSRRDTAARVDEMLDLVQMAPLARRKPDQLSGGQRQRVALARALARRPKLLLLDEPLGALDRKLREETQLELKKIQSSTGVTFVVVTHDQEEAMILGDRLGVMRDGRIEQVGTPVEVYEHPRSRFVAGFIGTANLLDGTIAEDARDHARIACPEAGLDIHVGHAVAGAKGEAVCVVLRPEKIALGAQAEGLPNRVEGRVEQVVYNGNLSMFHVSLPSGTRLRAARANTVRGVDAPGPGEAVTLGWPGSAAVVLPA